MTAIPRLALMIGESGSTSMTILGTDAESRAACLQLYAEIHDEIARFEARVKAKLGAPRRARSPEIRPVRVVKGHPPTAVVEVDEETGDASPGRAPPP
jgi:hypothetical protein